MYVLQGSHRAFPDILIPIPQCLFDEYLQIFPFIILIGQDHLFGPALNCGILIVVSKQIMGFSIIRFAFNG